MKRIFVMLCTLLFFLTSTWSKEKKDCKVSVVNWNVQTFFDSCNDGIEYPEFIKSKKWNSTEYEKRLDRLCTLIKQACADIYVFEEIENAAVLQDIANRLSGGIWQFKKNWNYYCFAKNNEDSIGCAVISRFMLYDMRTHNLQIYTEPNQPKMRPIIQVSVNTGTSDFDIIVNHWKSKSSGAKKSEIWRNWQESVLTKIIEDANFKNTKTLVCGDFNRDINEFYLLHKDFNFEEKTMPVKLRSRFLQNESVNVYSPWFTSNFELKEPGTYYYKENWERIDHFFVNGGIKFVEFYPLTNGNWAAENGTPKGYKIYSGEGWSDHLPIYCIIEL